MATKSKLEELNLSRDEVTRIGEALKDEKFRDLFREYAEEISDPENRRIYEEEIAQMERDRGMDVTFIKPEPGYVLKTSINGDQKAFINISKCDKLDKPSSERKQNDGGKSGLMWHIPHSFAPPREDFDKQKNRCKVYDFVIHPDTYRMAESNVRFKKLVEDTAMDGIEKQFGVKLDRKNVKHPKVQFKGTPTATVIRNRNDTGPQTPPDPTGLLKDMPYPYEENKTTLEKTKEQEMRKAKEQEKKTSKTAASNKTGQEQAKKEADVTVPKYTIVHQSELDMQEYRNAPDAKPSTRPRQLVIKVELPLLKSANQANLDIFEKRLLLESKQPAAYKLDLALPYAVDESEGSAKFDKQKRTLIVTLPVIPEKTPSMPSFANGTTSGDVGEECPTEKPLIEVLSNGIAAGSGPESQLQNGLAKDDGSETASVASNVNDKQSFSAHVGYTLPDFSFTQDTETVSFVLKVKNASEDTIRRTSPSNHEVKLMCTSHGEGGFPLHYSLYLRFAEGCGVVPDHSSVDVTADNVVLLLLKERQSRGLWDHFSAGLDADSLEEQLFLTTSNLQQQLAELDEASSAINEMTSSSDPAAVSDAGSPCDLQVTTMNEKKLTIKISPAKKTGSRRWKEEMAEEEKDEYDTPSSAEIEVVHTRPSPSLQSILKQRTVSESSEDINPDIDSPRSPVEDEDELSSSLNPGGKRRSVSFSKHIDKAMFKSSSAVSTMKTSLKSKRKRQRKWEEKQDKASARRRHNSTGSEGSGDDNTHSLSDSHSQSEEETVASDEKGVGKQKESSSEPRTTFNLRTTVSVDAPTSSSDLKADPSLSSVMSKSTEEEESQGENLREQSKAEVTNGIRAADDDKSSTDIRPVNGQSDGSNEKGSSLASKIKSKLAEPHKATREDDSDDEDEETVDGKGDDGDAKNSGQGAGNPSAADGNEHRTECAFQFSNDVMFDLDVE